MIKNTEIDKAIKHLSKNDKILFRLIKKYGRCNLTPRRRYFQRLLNAIIGQQLSMLAARSIAKKFYAYFDGHPKPEAIVKTEHETLRRLGLSNAKCRYVKDLSEKYLDGSLRLKGFSKMSDEEIAAHLTQVKGIGEWSAHMFLIFTLTRLNVLPVGDLGVRKGIMLNYGFENLPTAEEIELLSKKKEWSPYNSVAAWYMWESINDTNESN